MHRDGQFGLTFQGGGPIYWIQPGQSEVDLSGRLFRSHSASLRKVYSSRSSQAVKGSFQHFHRPFQVVFTRAMYSCVVFRLVCPMSAATFSSETLLSTNRLPNVWRKVCGVASPPARRARSAMRLRKALGVNGSPRCPRNT